MRKTILIFLSALILFTSTFILYNQSAQAAPVVSKVVSAAAKKVAKEVVKDQAVKQSMTILMNYEYKPKKEEKIQKPKESFTMVCLPQNKNSDGTCSKPMQVKKLNSADKKKLGQEAGKLLDKKIGHKGWKKFVDWFLPVWIIGAAITTVDLLIDGDLSSFFGDLGYEALVNLGFITNLTSSPDYRPIDYGDTPNDKDILPIDPDEVEESNKGVYLGNDYVSINLPEGIELFSGSNGNTTNGVNPYHITSVYLKLRSDRPYYYVNNGKVEELFSTSKRFVFIYFNLMHHGKGYSGKLKSLLSADLYVSNGGYFTVNSTQLVDTDITSYFDRNDEYIFVNNYKRHFLSKDESGHLLYLVEDFFNGLVAAPPAPMPQAKPDDIPVTKPGTTVTVPSPESVPVIDKNTGTQVRPTPDSTVDNPIWTTPDGTPVPEDDIEIGDIEITETPDGDIVQKPESNPNVEEGIIPKPENPTNPENPTDPETPDEEFPEGESCDAKFKKPKFDKLGQEISSTFPFNIPFDLYQSFINLFAKMGDKKPSFDLDLNFLGEKKTINITVPEYFDRWQPFAHTLIIFVFDVGLLWAIYRFTGGSK